MKKTEQQKRQIGDGINKRIIDKGRMINNSKNKVAKTKPKKYA